MKKKEILIIFVFAILATVFFGYFVKFPIGIVKPVFCIQMIGARCAPKINLTNTFLDFLFWYLILVGSWLVLKKFKKQKR